MASVLKVIKAAGIDLTAAASERMKRMHADPEFATRLAAAARDRMKRLHTDPESRRGTQRRPASA